MIEIEEARRLILERVLALPSETVDLRAALGRVLAEDVLAIDDVPGFENSAMDGFAVRAADTRGARRDSPVTLRVVDESRAGHPASTSLKSGEAIAISTGAVIPAGADAVVRVEQTTPGEGAVEICCEVPPGRDVRFAGEDIEKGQTVLGSGARLGPAELGVLASAGRPSVACTRRPRVWVLTTGDELIEPAEPLRAGAVRNSNAYAISALVEQAGAEVIGVATVRDDPERTTEAIARALEADVVAICGGVSVGVHDHVRGALSALDVEEVFWRIALKPGKPAWFGRRRAGGQPDAEREPGGQRGTLVFGLPGNPVSAMVTFTLLVRPALLALSGEPPAPRRTTARLERDYEKSPGRAHAVRCRLKLGEDGWHATPAEHQGSHVSTSMLGADALAIIPTESGTVHAGEQVEIELLPYG